MTREELKRIVFNTHNPLTVEEVMFGVDKYVEQIRAEVVDKYKELLKNYFVIPHDLMVIDMYAEKLKEQNK